MHVTVPVVPLAVSLALVVLTVVAIVWGRRPARRDLHLGLYLRSRIAIEADSAEARGRGVRDHAVTGLALLDVCGQVGCAEADFDIGAYQTRLARIVSLNNKRES